MLYAQISHAGFPSGVFEAPRGAGEQYAAFDLLSQGRFHSHGRRYVVVLHADHDLLLYG